VTDTATTPTPATCDDTALERRAARLEWVTTAANVFEAAAGITAGIAAASVAMVGFGAGAIVEVLASLAVLWHLSDRAGRTHTHDKLVMRIIAGAFIGVGVLTLAATARSLTTGEQAEATVTGIVLMIATTSAMIGLGLAKIVTGRRMRYAPLIANGRVTLVDGSLGAAVLLSLLLNAAFGWWWADPLCAAIVAILALREGVETWRGGHTGH
jgi:divalent metal cation (Fe/Co/Zn/Cd) transporter